MSHGNTCQLVVQSHVQTSAPPASLSIAFSPVKGAGGGQDLLVQKLTEIGVTDIYPLLPTRRSIAKGPRFGNNADTATPTNSHMNLSRLVKICRQASMQSRRVFLPTIHPPVSVIAISNMAGVALADPSGSALVSSDRFLVIGPEGGWDSEELALFDRRVSLGDTVLRSETAGVVAAALMASLQRS